MKDFNHEYEGTTSTVEEMHLEYQKLLQDYPDLDDRLNNLPGRVFSGKQHPSTDTKAVFFCYSLPAPPVQQAGESAADSSQWTEEAGFTHWYLYNLADGKIFEEPADIVALIRSRPDTPRHRSLPDSTLSEIRIKLEQYIKSTYLKKVMAPQGVKAKLKAWMELS